MLRSLEDLHGYDVRATGDDMGQVGTFLFDDESWHVRYLVVDTGGWLSERLTLIDPAAIHSADATSGRLRLGLTTSQIEESPGIDADQPVSRQRMQDLHDYYDWPIWWGAGAGLDTVGVPVVPPLPTGGASPEASATDTSAVAEDRTGDPHLRSAREVLGYDIVASDGGIGHVEDFIVDDEEWILRYLIVDTRNWLPGRKVMMALPWVDRIDWGERAVHFDLDRASIRGGPEFDPEMPVNRELEERLYDYYGRPRYWS